MILISCGNFRLIQWIIIYHPRLTLASTVDSYIDLRYCNASYSSLDDTMRMLSSFGKGTFIRDRFKVHTLVATYIMQSFNIKWLGFLSREQVSRNKAFGILQFI